jgi:AAHS family 4-hydroxybenzoate transporter-like MFS transporter
MPQPIDVAQLLDRSSWSTYQKLLTLVAALAVIFDGFDIQILGFAIPSLMREWHAARGEFGVVLALGLAGMVIGSPIAGACGDRFGRRPALIGCVLVFAIATVGTAFVHGFFGLSVMRLLTGMGTGGALPNASALTAEFAPLRRRGTAVKLTLICVPLGGMLGGLLAAWILPSLGWRGLYAIGGTLPLLFAIVLWAAVPESPRFLARRQEHWPELARLLTRIGHAIPEGAAFEDRAERDAAGSASPAALFRGRLARDTAGLWVAFLFCLGSIYLVFGWLPAMLTSRGLDLATASLGLTAYNLGGVFGVLLWAVLITVLGSRGPLLSGALACAGSALALLIVPIQAHGDHLPLIACLAVNGLLANAVQTSMYALATHVYPTGIRATGVAYAATLGRAGGLVASLCGSYIIQAGPGVYWQALALAMVVAFAGLAWVRGHYPGAQQLDRLERAGVAH